MYITRPPRDDHGDILSDLLSVHLIFSYAMSTLFNFLCLKFFYE